MEKLKKMTDEEWVKLRRSTAISHWNEQDMKPILFERLREMFEGFEVDINESYEFDSPERIHELIEMEYRSWKKYRMLEGVALDMDSVKLLSDHELVYEGLILDCLKFVKVFKLSWDYDEITGGEID